MRAQAGGLSRALGEVLQAEVSEATTPLARGWGEGGGRPDVVVGCGSAAVWPALNLKRRFGAFAVFAQRPAWGGFLFDAVLRPRHDGPGGGNALSIVGAVGPVSGDALKARRAGAVARFGDGEAAADWGFVGRGESGVCVFGGGVFADSGAGFALEGGDRGDDFGDGFAANRGGKCAGAGGGFFVGGRAGESVYGYFGGGGCFAGDGGFGEYAERGVFGGASGFDFSAGCAGRGSGTVGGGEVFGVSCGFGGARVGAGLEGGGGFGGFGGLGGVGVARFG